MVRVRTLVREARRLRNALDGLSDPGPLRGVLVQLVIDSGVAELPEKDAIDVPRDWIEDRFRRWLGRMPEEAELKTFLEVFHDPASRPETLVYALLSHPEYHSY